MLHDGLRDGGFLAGDRAFAEPDQPAVGVDLAEHPVQAARVHHERLQPGDLQVEGLGSRRSLPARSAIIGLAAAPSAA